MSSTLAALARLFDAASSWARARIAADRSVFDGPEFRAWARTAEDEPSTGTRGELVSLRDLYPPDPEVVAREAEARARWRVRVLNALDVERGRARPTADDLRARRDALAASGRVPLPGGERR